MSDISLFHFLHRTYPDNPFYRIMDMMGDGEPGPHLSMESLIWHINKGDYASAYEIGDLIPMKYGSYDLNMQIVAFDKDVKADGTGFAPVSLYAEAAQVTTKRMNPTLAGESPNYTVGTGTIGGWKESEMRAYCNSSILAALPQIVQDHIIAVEKTSYSYNSAGTASSDQTSEDKIWLASSRELGENGYETDGVQYTDIFSSNAARVKMTAGTETVISYWTRTASTTANFRRVYTNGAFTVAAASIAWSVVFGFCLG